MHQFGFGADPRRLLKLVRRLGKYCSWVKMGPNTPSCRGVQLKAQGQNLPFTSR